MTKAMPMPRIQSSVVPIHPCGRGMVSSSAAAATDGSTATTPAARHASALTLETTIPSPLSRSAALAAARNRSQVRHEIGHLVGAERRPGPTLALGAWIVDERMVPQRREGAGRRVDAARPVEVARAFALLAVEPVTIEAALVHGEDHAFSRVARLTEVAHRIQIRHDVGHLVRPQVRR